MSMASITTADHGHHHGDDGGQEHHHHHDPAATSWVGSDGRVYHSHDGLAPHSHEPIYSPGLFSKRAPPLPVRNFRERAFTVGIGGPVGTGKTALMLALCEFLRDKYSLAADLPWCEPALSTADLPWLVGDLDSQRARFAFWSRTLDRSRHLRWLAVNTFPGEAACRRRTTAALPNIRRPPPPCTAGPRVFHVAGPAAEGGAALGLSFWEEDRSCLRWLEEQLPGSVVYVSFGSWVGPVGDGLVAELALGLEATGRPYLWVLGDSWRGGLPPGFLGRRRRGKVVAWAPQREVLRHAAVGCYLTHCGWNSTMEAVQCRKPLLCHPVAGDQRINCRYIVEVWGVGVRLRGMRREAVREGVERVMSAAEGGELQRRVTEMGVKLLGEEGGQSAAAAELSAFAEEVNAAGMEYWRGGEGWSPPPPGQMSFL